MRPSKLYERLGLTGPFGQLVNVTAGSRELGDKVHSIRISRGGSDLSSHTPSTITVETPENIDPSEAGSYMNVTLDPTAAAAIAAATGETVADVQWRYRGRIATLNAHDRQPRRHLPATWRGTTIVGAAWSSLYQNAPDLFTPAAGTTLRAAAQALFLPSWSPFATLEWNGNTEEWPAPEPGQTHDPITAADLLQILGSRLYMLGDTRQGHFRVSALNALKGEAADAAVNTWPLARAHALTPTTWDQPSTYPTEYRIQLLDPFGNVDEIVTAPGGVPTGETRVVDQDWTEIVQTTEQWRRIHGVRWETFQTSWRLPSLTIRLDHMLASPYTGHRRAAGMLLRLNVGDPVPLAGDWPDAIDGIHLATSLEETITPEAWTLTVGLQDYRALDGSEQFPIKPRTWAQAGTRTWADAGTATWNQGVPA